MKYLVLILLIVRCTHPNHTQEIPTAAGYAWDKYQKGEFLTDKDQSNLHYGQD